MGSYRRILGRYLLVDALAVCLLQPCSYGQTTPEKTAASQIRTINLFPFDNLSKPLPGTLEDKVDAVLIAARTSLRTLPTGSQQDASVLGDAAVLRISPQREVQCYVYLEPYSESNVQALVQIGFRLDIAVPEMKVAQGWLLPDSFESIAKLSFVKKIRAPDYGVSRCVGSVCTEADSLLKADQLRSQGYMGTGIKIGVISNGAISRSAAIANGNLPDSVVVNPQMPGTGEEGTAMMEIIHDLAPNASLFFSGPQTSAEMVQAINWLVAQSVDVIVDDLGFFNEPFFADGPVAMAAQSAVLIDNRVYVTAAGNDCRKHYQGLFEDFDGAGPSHLHDFDSGVGVSKFLLVDMPPGVTLTVRLQWNDPFQASQNDYDLGIVNPITGAVLGVPGTSVQNGDVDPIENASYENTTGLPRTVGIIIENYQGLAAPRVLELFTNLDIQVVNANCADSIFGHPAIPEVISCGTINASQANTGVLAAYSSRGPSTISFPNPVIRQTPFLTGIDGVSVSGAGGFSSPFFGTSASAPHVAAIAGLLLEAANKSVSPAQIRAALAAGVIDRGTLGFDNMYGYGQLDGMAALNQLCPKPSLSKAVSASDDESPFQIAITWAVDGPADTSEIWRAESDDPTKAQKIGESASVPYYDQDNLNPGTEYFYWVRIVKGCAKSDFGSSDRGSIQSLSPPPPQVAPGCGICGVGLGPFAGMFCFIAVFAKRSGHRKEPNSKKKYP